LAVAEPVVLKPLRRLRPPTLPRAMRRISRLDRMSIYLLVGMTLVAAFAPLLAPYSSELPAGPSFKAPLSGGFLLGTDDVGRDILSRVLLGMRSTWFAAIAVILSGVLIGGIIGLIAGASGGWVDSTLMRFTDLFLVVPAIAVLAIALKQFGQTPNTIILVLAGLGWMYIARVVRGQVLSIKEKEFVEAARAAGASSKRVIVRHIMPNCIGPIFVNATLAIAAAIVTESTLSFLGFGVQPPDTSWGNMLANAEGNYSIHTHLLYFPGFMILLTVLFVNFLGDGLRDAFDPQHKH